MTKIVSDADWSLIEGAVKKVIDTTLSRAEHKQLSDMLARARPASPTYGDAIFGLVESPVQDFRAGK